MSAVLGKWDFIVAVALAAVAGYYLPADAPKDITTELIAFFSIQSAVILPAMIFTAGIMKPDGLELKDAQRYHKALKQQMQFWVVLLGLDFVAVVALIAGKAFGWEIEIAIPKVSKPLELSWVLPTILTFSGALAVLRTIPFVKGVLSLLDLNSDMTQKAISRRNKREEEERRSRATSETMSLPVGYGKVLEPGAD
ncbi:hypothetical protein [Sinorhizobium meliloti]|uniref:hypothetical protein n=1 Tax=Rhizobium meliloti TaxID=382 RepID=UPI000FD9AF78|nr:hypothetical protein [Sinorhizobium meliloti]RVG29767.1 hypothetical protein CN225_24200 [Sinorhizobium meliloti]